MKFSPLFVSFVVAVPTARAFLRMGQESSEDGFDPKTQLGHLLDKTKEVKSAFENDSLQIDSLLQKVVGKKPSSSLVELESASAIATEREAFEKHKTALLEQDGSEVAKRQREFAQAMQKLRRDTASLLKKEHVPPSFLEIQSKYADGNLEQYFDDSHRLVDQVRELADSIHSQSEVVVEGIHKKLVALQEHSKSQSTIE